MTASVGKALPVDAVSGQVASSSASRRDGVVELALVVLVLVVGFWLRVDRLMLVPTFTDESMEVLLAADTLDAGRLNLVGVSSFLGGLHTWLLMGIIALPGAWLDGPRLLSLAAGMLTIVFTVLLGRELGGRWAGLLAGALLATCLTHVLINSRIAWSNAVTPLFMTAALWLLTRALERRRAWLCLPAGLCVGLALQTHPSAAALLPGLVLGVLLTPVGRRILRTPWPWLGGLAAIVAYANVLWFNLTTGGRSLAAAQEREYAVHPAGSAGELATNLGALLTQLARSSGSSFVAGPGEPAYPITLTMLGVGLLALIGTVALARRGQWLLPVLLPTSAVMMALIGGEYLPLPHASSRYLGSLWPPLFVLAGVGAVEIGRRVRPTRYARPALAALAIIGLALVALPVQTNRTYLDWYGARPWIGSSNQFALATAAEIAARFPNRAAYLDTALYEDRNSDAGNMHRSLSMLLRLQGNTPVTQRRTQRTTLGAVWEQLGNAPGPALLRRDHAQTLTREGAVLTPIGDATRVLDPAAGEVRLYEVRLAKAGVG